MTPIDYLQHELYKHKPFEHQARIFAETAERPYHALFMEMGTGKSKLLIDTMAYLWLAGKLDRALIIAKKGEYANWIYDQLPEHWPVQSCGDIFDHLWSSAKVKSKEHQLMVEGLLSPAIKMMKILVVNVEALRSRAALDVAKKFLRAGGAKAMLAVDESTCVKHHASSQSKAVLELAGLAGYRRIMTGSPVTERPLDIWGQALVLKPGILGHRSFYSFRGEYAQLENVYLGQRVIKTVTGYKNTDKLKRVIKSFSTMITKAECLDLPPKIYRKLYVDLTPEQSKLYQDFVQRGYTELGDTFIDATTALGILSKLHQICCGQLKTYLDDSSPENYTAVPTNKMPALLDLLEDHPGKAIIWSGYRRTLHDVTYELQQKFGLEAVGPYYGNVSDGTRKEVVQRFQDPADPLRFIVANPQSAGYGLTLTQADLVVYYSNSFSLEHRLQSEDRAHRIGQTRPVVYVDIVARETVDDKILGTLRAKRALEAELMARPNLEAWV